MALGRRALALEHSRAGDVRGRQMFGRWEQRLGCRVVNSHRLELTLDERRLAIGCQRFA